MCGGPQFLRLLLVLVLLLPSTFGIVCYKCQTKRQTDRKIDEAPATVKVMLALNGTTEPPRRVPENETLPTLPPLPAREPPGPTPAAEPPTPAPTDEPPVAPPGAECLKGEKDDKDLWEEIECEIGFKACFIRKGVLVERKGDSIYTYQITERGCFSKDVDPFYKNVTHVVDQRLKQDMKDDIGSKFNLIVCDELNGGEMLCNRGTPSMSLVNFSWLTGSLSFLLLL